MPLTPFVGFIGPSYTLPSVASDAQRTVNWYPEINEIGTGKNHEVARMAPTPGLRKITTAGTGPNRAFKKASNGRLFLVSGVEFYELIGDSATLIGTLDSGNGQASISDNGHQLVVVSDGHGWILDFTDGDSFLPITDENFPNADTVDFLDQYMIVNDRDTGNFQISALADATSWDGLDIASPEASPDKLLTFIVDHQEAVMFSTQTVQFFFDSGDESFPISPRIGAQIEGGIIGVGAKAKFDNRVGFWKQDKDGGAIACIINGYNAQRVSTNAIEAKIQAYGDVSGATCWSYQDKGQTFWCTNFPGANTTWVLNVANNLWHERMTADGRHRAENHVFDGTRHLVGDYENGNIYELSDSEYTDNGEFRPKIRACPHLSAQTNRVAHHGFFLDMDTGTAPLGLDAKAMLRWSDDGGRKWKRERIISIGKRGQYGKLTNWLRLGASRDRVYELKITDALPVTLLGAFLDMEAEES